MKKKKEIYPTGVAVIGTGYWGRNLVRNYAELGALRLICDKNESVLNALKAQYPSVDICFALNEVLNRDDIQGVVIATPAETHFTLVREALLSGKHAYVEKPLVLQAKEAVEVIRLAEEKERRLMVGHLLQYHPAFEALKNMVVQGGLGRINYIYSHRLNLGKIRREENILWSFAPHDISMILALTGEEPEAVLATGGNYLHRKIADVTTTHLEFSSGLRAHIFVSWLHPFKEQKLVVVGDRKMAVFDDTKPWPEKLLLYPHEIRWENGMPVPDKGEPECVHIPEKEPLRLECEHFLHCISSGITPLTDGHEGLRVLRVLNACQRSLNEDGRRIELQPQSRGVDAPTAYYVDPQAVVDKDVTIGAGTKIWHFSHILSGTCIGLHCNIGQNVVVGPNVRIGNGCKIQNNVSIYPGVTLEDDVFCGSGVVFTNVFNPRARIRRMDEIRPTLLKQGATLGANATIVCGRVIGRHAFIGAGAVVTGDVRDYALMMGNPARQTGWMCACGEKLDATLYCNVCRKQYVEQEQGLFEIIGDVTAS
jgi:UDP-2-acetamido-3-amino-2,3-dideoxy-glucuronate N-acetyltransferase